jgi:hypothetical protein
MKSRIQNPSEPAPSRDHVVLVATSIVFAALAAVAIMVYFHYQP